jgi:hypothetical protein
MLLSSAACQCRAEDLSQPINQFVKRLFQGAEIQTDFREMWTGTPEASPSRRDPNGGYLFRFQLQFEGSNDTLLFIASDRFGDVRRNTPAWSVYQSTQQNPWRLVSTGEMLQSGGISVHHQSRTIIQEFPDRFADGKTFVTLQINTSGSTEKKRYRSGEVIGDAKEIIEKAVVPSVLKIEKIPLITYLRFPQTEWRSLSEHGMVAQSLDPEDAPLLDSNYDVTWDEALALSHRLSAHKDSSVRPERQSRPGIDISLLQTPEADTTPASSKASPTEPTGSKAAWISIVVLIAVLIGLLWFFPKSQR